VSVAATQVVERAGVWARVRSARLETKLAVGGLSAIALHVLDDNFFQRAPGTTVADHLISALVPLAILIAAALAYPRVRAGLRASIAIAIGLLGIVIGAIEPAYYWSKEGLSGDDYTGLLAAAGGLLLVIVGLAVLWRSRKRDDSLLWRYPRRGLLAIGAALTLGFVIFPLSLSYGFTHAARTTTERGNLGRPYETVSFESSDGLSLNGWFVPSKNGATVIVYPGKKGTQKHARMLTRHGYGVLVLDRRGEGDSEGDANALGWGFDGDLKGAIAYLRSRSDVDRSRIGGLGLSVGGEAFLQTAAETKQLGAVVSDGAGSRSVREDVVRMRAGKAPEIFFSSVMTAGTALFSNEAPPPSLKDLSGQITTPVFFIHAVKGAGGEENNPEYYAAARGPKQIWKIDTSHTHGLTDYPEEYERRVIGFFDQTLRS
jgi:uncharacterized protein